MDHLIISNCPHCHDVFAVHPSEINCAIFRHGVLKHSGQQVDPHASKEVCDELAASGSIIGCGKPFKLIRIDSFGHIAQKCDYI